MLYTKSKLRMKLRMLFFLLLSLLRLQGFSQLNINTDSLINKMCETLKANNTLSDSQRVVETFKKHLFPYLLSLEKSEQNNVAFNIDMRFQRLCKEYGELITRNTPQEDGWKRVDGKPTVILRKSLCTAFLDRKKYYYFTTLDDTVRVTIENGLWTENFKDGSYSNLKFKWINSCEFQIEFIQSNNSVRKEFSRVGDKYNYQILNKADSYYDMSVEIVGTKQYMTFKLYY